MAIAHLTPRPRDTPRSWRDRAILLAPVAALLALTGVTEDGPTICPIALATGTVCPGCGTRALAFLVRGDLDVSGFYHPLAPLIAIEALAVWAWYLLRRRGLVRPLPRMAGNLIVILTAVSLLGVWALRSWSGSLPPV